MRLLARSVIEKFDEGDSIVKEFISQSSNMTCGTSESIEDAIEHFIISTGRNLANLNSTPSGYSLVEVTSLTLITTYVPDIRGGCGEYLSSIHKKSERRGLFPIKSKEDFGQNQCFKDAVLFQVFGKDIMKKLIRKYRANCPAKKHYVGCECYLNAEKNFLELASDQEYWFQFYNHKRINWEGIKFPAGLDDVSRFSDQNPNIHIRAHLIYGSSATCVFIGQRTKEQKYFVDVCFSEFHSFDTHEIMGHWYPVKNIAEFTSKILRKKVNSNHVHKRYGEDSCEKCLLHHHFPTDVSSDFIDPKHKIDGFLRYRDKYCPYPIPENFHLSDKHREHIKICGMENEFMFKAEESPSMIMTPKSKYFLFSNYKQTVDDRFSGFFDLETFNQPLEPLCLNCEELIKTTKSHSKTNEIYTKCLNEHHFRQNSFKCDGCLSKFKTALASNQCTCHSEDENHEKVLNNCLECFRNEEKKFSDCNHITTQNIKKLETSGYAFILFDNYRKQVVKSKVYFQKSEKELDPLEHFMKYLRNDISDYVQQEFGKVAPMVISEEEEREYQEAQFCYCCYKKSTSLMKDHCHVLGNYRGAICRRCNKILTIRNEVSIWAHNLTGFDGHMVLKSLGKGWDSYRIIPRNSEKFTGISMSKKFNPSLEISAIDLMEGIEEVKSEDSTKDKYIKFTFKDTMSFLQGSLDNNTKKLKDSSHPFPFLKNSELCKTNGIIDEEKLKLLVRKGSYPYDLIQNHSDLHRKTFASKNEFFSSLGIGKHISNEDWEHGEKVWRTFQCNSMLDYSEIYVLLDAFLLLESWEPVCLFTSTSFGIFPAHFYTLPSLAMACCLKGLHDDREFKKIELLQDFEMIDFVSKAKRGGLTSTLGTRLVYSRAGAKDVKKAIGKIKDQDPRTIYNLKKAVDKVLKKELKKDQDYAILYLDANNLYGEAQTMPLPHSGFHWAPEEDLKWINMFFEARASGENLKWDKYCNDETGYFIEADIEFPEHLKEKMSNFPPAPHKVKIDKDSLSEYARNMIDESNENYLDSEKLCVTLCSKKKYITHHKLMDLYSQIGAKVSNITRCLKFKQHPFLKKWVDINTEGRMTAQKAGNEIKKSFHKLW